MNPLPLPTLDDYATVLREKAGGVLHRGAHEPPNGACQCCVEELDTLTRAWFDAGKPQLADWHFVGEWTDSPDGATPTERACQRLNDGRWSSDQARTDGCLPLVVLRETDAPKGWVRVYIKATIRVIVPLMLRRAAKHWPEAGEHRVALLDAADRCEREGTRDSAVAGRDVALRKRADAAAAAYAADADAAYAAAYAADADAAAAAAAYAADADKILRVGCALLLASHRGPTPWLDADVLAAVAEAT